MARGSIRGPGRRRDGSEAPASGYDEDLAAVHDAGFGALAEHAGALLVDELRRRSPDGGLVVELGCGSGVLAERLGGAGYRVLGVDLSLPLVARARRRAPAGAFAVASLLDVAIPRCVAVAAIGECFNYLFDPRNTASARRALLRRVHAGLEPGGTLLFDVAGPGRLPGGGDRVSTEAHREGDGWAVLMSAEEDRRRRVLTRRITTFRRVGELYRRSYEVHRLRLLPPREVLAELRSLGFRARALRRYGALRLPRGLVAFLARKA